jgi:hypothetical protein
MHSCVAEFYNLAVALLIVIVVRRIGATSPAHFALFVSWN